VATDHSLDFTIRNLTSADIPELIALWHASGLPLKEAGRDRPDMLKRELETYPNNFIGAFEEGELIGVVLATWDGRKGWINRLAVRPDRRRSGVALALVKAAEAELERRGAMIIAAMIEPENETSIRFFASAGYEDYRVVYVTKRKGKDV